MKSKITSVLHDFFTQNIGYKVAALLIGIVVWALLSNTEDPIKSKDLYVPVTYLYEEKLLNEESLCVISAPSTIRITVQVRNSNLSKVKAELFSCTADLMSHTGGDMSAQLVHADVSQNSGFDMILDWSYYKSDPNITVALDEYIEKTFYVGLRTTGTLPDGLFFGGSQDFAPGTVTVSGPKSKFGNLASVKATVDLQDLGRLGSGFFEEELELQMFDSNDNVITDSDGNLTMSAAKATLYSVLIRERTMAVRAAGTVGTPAFGYRVMNVTVEPEIIEVNGLDTNFSDMTEITLPESVLDVTGISSDTVYQVDVRPYLPEGVSVTGDGIINVTVTLEAMTTLTFTYSKADFVMIEQEAGYDYSVADNTNVTIRLRGFAENLANVNASAFQPVLNVKGLSEGRNRVKIQVTELPGVVIDNADSLTVAVTKTKHAEEQSSESDGSSTEDGSSTPEGDTTDTDTKDTTDGETSTDESTSGDSSDPGESGEN